MYPEVVHRSRGPHLLAPRPSSTIDVDEKSRVHLRTAVRGMTAPSACSSRRRSLRRHRRRLEKLATLALYTLGMHLGGAHGFDYGLHQLPRSSRARADGASRRGCRRAPWLDPLERQARATGERYHVSHSSF